METTTKGVIRQQIADSIRTKELILSDEKLISAIENAATIVSQAYEKGNKTLLAGNGGSAADAQHIACEFVSKFYFDRPGIPSIALTTNTSIITAVSNDYGYNEVFARQIEAHGVKGDVFIAISTSGNAENIIEALKICKENEIFTIGLTGETGGKMAEFCDICIKVPSIETPRIQESHILIGHIICCIVEDDLFGHLL